MTIPGKNPFSSKPESYSPPNYTSEDFAKIRDEDEPPPPVKEALSYNSDSQRHTAPPQALPNEIVDVDINGNPTYARSKPEAVPAPKKVVDYHQTQVIGLDKCTRCGSADMTYSIEKNALICGSCRFEDKGVNVAERFGSHENIAELEGRTVTSGAQSILSDEIQVTVKCQGCGAEVAINTDEGLVGRCHWCRQQLSINNQIPNGAVPDGILPFRLSKDVAMSAVKKFASKRRFFAQKRFKAEFSEENVFGIYLPYVIADAKFSGGVEGVAQKHLRSYTRNKSTYYDYEEYQVTREIAALADDISIEASSKRQIETASNTNNVINAVLPFPIEEAVDFRAHYLNGFNSERRDVDIEALDQRLVDQMLTIVRAKADDTMEKYQRRGVRWEREWTELHGAHQATIYLPIWLYSYVEENAKNPRTKIRGPLIHYIAVNGITGSTMGSIPVAKGKLQAFSWLIGTIVGIPAVSMALVYWGIFPYWLFTR